jgi:D-alanyl-D-alanine carboxypeptidase
MPETTVQRSASDVDAQFAAVARQLLAESGAPGLTAAYVSGDGIAHAVAFGLADTEAGQPMTVRSRMPGGSTGKTIVAATALSIVHDGTISLDAPLSKILGGEAWYAHVPNADALTLRLLLGQTSGVPDHMGMADVLSRFFALRRTSGPEWYCAPRDAVAFVLDKPPVTQPGTAFYYSDTNYILAALALEAATGRELHDLQRERVLVPLGLEDIEPARGRFYDELASGYTDAPEGSPMPRKTVSSDGGLVYSPRTEWAGGGLVSGVRGLAKFIRLYASGRAFGWPYLDQVLKMTRYSWAPDQIGGYGLGVFGAGSPLGETIGHGGYYPGYRTQMTYFRDHDIAVAYQLNSSATPTWLVGASAARAEAARTSFAADAAFTPVVDGAVKLAAAVLGHQLKG